MKHQIDRLLQERQPTPEVPDGLHESIMDAVRAGRAANSRAQRMEPGASWFAWPRLAYAFALVAILSLSAINFVNKASEQRKNPDVQVAQALKLDPALADKLQQTWNLMDEVGNNAPALLAQPIAQQLDQLSSEIHKTTDTLLASLPTFQPPQQN